jgi:hypothetical protein
MRLRLRDVRAILFCLISTTVVSVTAFLWAPNRLIGFGLVFSYLVFILTRPRVQRVIARLRDIPSWRGYFRN